MSKPKILVFIPCYNCAEQIGRTIAQITPDIAQYLGGILVVDNGSTDGTREKAEKALRQVKGLSVALVQNTENYHLGGSHKTAFRFARQNGYSHVCILHGDDQGNIQDFATILPKVAQQPEMTWLGSRFAWGSKLIGYSMVRILGNVAFNIMFSLATRRHLTDLGSCLNIFALKELEKLKIDFYGDNLLFNYYLILGMCYNKVPFRYVPMSLREEDQVSNVKMFQHGRNTLLLLGRYILAPQKFLNTDHRSVARTDYTWKVLYNHG